MAQSTRQSSRGTTKPGTKTVIIYVWWCGDCIKVELGSSKAPVCRCKKKMERIGWTEESVQEHTKGTN